MRSHEQVRFHKLCLQGHAVGHPVPRVVQTVPAPAAWMEVPETLSAAAAQSQLQPALAVQGLQRDVARLQGGLACVHVRQDARCACHAAVHVACLSQSRSAAAVVRASTGTVPTAYLTRVVQPARLLEAGPEDLARALRAPSWEPEAARAAGPESAAGAAARAAMKTMWTMPEAPGIAAEAAVVGSAHLRGAARQTHAADHALQAHCAPASPSPLVARALPQKRPHFQQAGRRRRRPPVSRLAQRSLRHPQALSRSHPS